MMEALIKLRENVEALIREHHSVKSELLVARKALTEKKSEVEVLREQLSKTEESLLAVQIGKSIPDATVREANRRKLDAVISEIDKILTTLP